MVADQGYETSPAPSLDVSLDFGSDDSVKDPPYAPSNHSSDIITDSECSAPPSPSSNTNPVCSLPEGTTQENEMDLENNILQESPNIVILSNIRLENKSQLVSSVSYNCNRGIHDTEILKADLINHRFLHSFCRRRL